MPNRIIKESITTSEEIEQCSWMEEVLFYRLIVKCDDYGRFDGRVKIIKGQCFPLRDITTKDIEKALDRLTTIGLVKRYTVAGHEVLQLTTWETHQRVRNKVSKYPGPEEADNQLTIDSNSPTIDSNCPLESNPNPNPNPNTNPESRNIRNAQSADSRSRFRKPTLDEVTEYINENYFLVTPEEFYDYYESNGWKVGRNPMKDWKATVRNWNSKEQKKGQHKKGDLVF